MLDEGEVEGGQSRGPGRWKPWIVRGLFESALIVFSVLLALALSQWLNERELERRVQDTRRFFAEEVAANQKLLADPYYLPHHKALGRGLVEAAQAGPESPGFDAKAYALFESGAHPTPFREAVWSSISGSEIMARMPPEEVFQLSDIYRLQKDLAATHSGMYATLVGMDPEDRSPKAARGNVRALQLYMGDVVGLESTLQKRYEKVLASLTAPPRRAR